MASGPAPMRWADLRAARAADRTANAGNLKSQLVLASYRWAHYFVSKRSSAPLLWALGLPAQVAHRLLVEWVLGVEIPAKVEAGPGITLWHGQALVLHPTVRLGSGVTLRHNTTIGPKRVNGVNTAAPVLGDRVDVGANAVIIGPVTVGDDAVIGAGAVVVADVPASVTVVGNPARPIARHAPAAPSQDSP